MKKTQILLFIILGVLATVAMVFPTTIILGLFLGIVPGIILTLAPTVFMYYALALVLGIILKLFKVPYPVFVSLILLISLGCYASYLLNQPLLQQVREFEKLDVALEDKFELPSIVAIYSKQYETHGDMCNAICQGLLYNKVAKKVLVVTDPSGIKNNSDQLVSSYEIEYGGDCTNEYLISKRWGKLAEKNVETRLAAGECIVKKEARLFEANIVFYHEKIIQNRGYKDYASLKRRVIFVDFIELLRNEGDTLNKIYRYSEISAQPFAYPLSFGPILGAVGGNMSLDFGFFHTSLTVNNPGPSYGNPIQEFKPQMEAIFGEALKPIKPPEQNIKQLVVEALDSTGGKMAGHSLIGKYLQEMCDEKRTPTNEDLNIVVKALGDDRVDNWSCLNGFSQQWYEEYHSLPKEYLYALVNRVLRNNGDSYASGAIRFLPDGEAAIIYPQLERIIQDKVLRESAYGSIIRLGDAGVKAIPLYMNILDEFSQALVESDYNLRVKKLRTLEDAPIASVIGLCRLGQEALPAKNALYQLLDKVGHRSTIGGSTIDALIEMGLFEELEQRYQSNEEVLKEIKDAFVQKEQATKRGRRFCDRRIV